MRHFWRALDCSSPSLTRVVLATYARWGSVNSDGEAPD